MIIGIGTDIVDIHRIKKLLDDHGSRFKERCFTNQEQDYADSKSNELLNISAYAKRFAAKEAAVKALGTGFVKGIKMTDIEVLNADAGQPFLRFHNGAEKVLAGHVPAGMHSKIHLSLSDEPPYAQAYVIIEALPNL
ncbi:MAG: holo-ACP synthase [Alphaproteobacteria bacterium]|nr:holo-ACP synthase [Alphaproteobacteria bacterium]